MFFLILQVCTNEEEEKLARGSKKSEKLREDLMRGAMLPNRSEKFSKGLERAIQQKDRLLEYDRTR